MENVILEHDGRSKIYYPLVELHSLGRENNTKITGI